jgi:hypothetical protein
MHKNAQKDQPRARPVAAKKKLSGKWSKSLDALEKRKSKGLQLPGADGPHDPAT